MYWDPQKLLLNIRQADTDDLLDRVTAYRPGMEAEAIGLIEDELHRRGISAGKIQAFREECERDWLFQADGCAKMCSFCRKPAVAERWGWHRLWGKIPLTPRLMRYCKQHDQR